MSEHGEQSIVCVYCDNPTWRVSLRKSINGLGPMIHIDSLCRCNYRHTFVLKDWPQDQTTGPMNLAEDN